MAPPLTPHATLAPTVLTTDGYDPIKEYDHCYKTVQSVRHKTQQFLLIVFTVNQSLKLFFSASILSFNFEHNTHKGILISEGILTSGPIANKKCLITPLSRKFEQVFYC